LASATNNSTNSWKTFQDGAEKVVKVAEGELLKVCRAEALEKVKQQRLQDVDLRAKVGICEQHAGGVCEQLVPAASYGRHNGVRTGSLQGAMECGATLVTTQHSSQYGVIPCVDSARLHFCLRRRHMR